MEINIQRLNVELKTVSVLIREQNMHRCAAEAEEQRGGRQWVVPTGEPQLWRENRSLLSFLEAFALIKKSHWGCVTLSDQSDLYFVLTHVFTHTFREKCADTQSPWKMSKSNSLTCLFVSSLRCIDEAGEATGSASFSPLSVTNDFQIVLLDSPQETRLLHYIYLL